MTSCDATVYNINAQDIKIQDICSGGRLGGGSLVVGEVVWWRELGGFGSWLVDGVWSRVEGRWVVGERGGDTGTDVCSDRTFLMKDVS